MKNRWAPWIAALLLWSTLGVLFALPALSSGNWSRVLLGSLAQWWSWGLVAPLIFWTDAQLPFKENQLAKRIVAYLLASVPLTLLYFYVVIALQVSLGLVGRRALAHPPALLNTFGLLWIQVASDVKYALVPCLIVQPLVENAIRHGISPRASGGAVRVTAQRRADRLEIRVADDGVGLPSGWMLETSSGMGLSVTRERILGLYPDGDGSFSVRPRSGGGTEVEISLPLRFAGERASGPTR
jgi:hypothetical protein